MMSSFANHSGKRYYIHSKNNKLCPFHKFVPADDLENSVLLQLVKTFGDVELLQKAIKKATPDTSERTKLVKEQGQLEKSKKQNEVELNNLVDAVSKGLLTDLEIIAKRNKIKSSLTDIQSRLNAIYDRLTKIPDPIDIKAVSQFAGRVIKTVLKNSPKLIFERDYNWKRKLVEQAFSGVDLKGSHLGVYIDTTNKRKTFKFEISGSFFQTVDTFPMTDSQIMEKFNLDQEYMTEDEIRKELDSIRLNLQGKCNAYHIKRFYQ
jgi:hypothetical protein